MFKVFNNVIRDKQNKIKYISTVVQYYFRHFKLVFKLITSILSRTNVKFLKISIFFTQYIKLENSVNKFILCISCSILIIIKINNVLKN